MALFKKILITFLLTSTIHSKLIASEDEELFISRIADFYEEGDLKLAEKHCEEFLQGYPDSPYRSSLLLLKGEILLKNKRFNDALEVFNEIYDPHLQLKVKTGIGWALYYLKRFDLLESFSQQELSLSPLFHFFYAESKFRQGLTLFEKGEKERATTYFYEAELSYQTLLNSEKKIPATLALAEIYRLTNQGYKALNFFESIAKDSSIEPLSIRITAALHIGKHDIKKSAEVLEYLWLTSFSDEASIRWLEAVIKLENFSEIRAKRDLLLSRFTNDYSLSSLAYFYLAQAYLNSEAVCDLQMAIKDLVHFVSCFENDFSMRSFILKSLSQLIDLFLAIQDFDAAESWFGKLDANQPEDDLLVEKILQLANVFRSNNISDKSLKYANICIQRYKNHSDSSIQEKVFRAHLVKLMNNVNIVLSNYWEIESELFEKYYGSPYFSDMLRFALNASDIHLKNSLNLDFESIHKHRIFILKQLLKEPLSDDEQALHKLELAHSFLFCHQTQSAKKILEEYKECKLDKMTPQIFYLLALAFEDTPLEFIVYAEKALNLSLNSKESLSLHVKLFHCYFMLNEEAKAAHHLYMALKEFSSRSDIILSRDNQKWAACYYYDKFKNSLDLSQNNKLTQRKVSDKIEFNDEALERSIYIFSTLFKMESDKKIVIDNFISETKYLYYLADLLEHKGEFSFSQYLFKQLVLLKERNPEKTFFSEGLADLRLAKSLEKQCPEEALKIYQRIINNSFANSISAPAKLAFYKLKYKLESGNNNIDSSEISSILKEMRLLKIQRDAATEPCHIESGFEMIEYVFPVQKAYDKRLFQLKHFKEELLSQNDLAAKDYHIQLSSMPDKKQFFNAYLRLIDAAILECEAKLCQNEQEKSSKSNRAFALYSTLRQGKHALNDYLIEKAFEGMQRTR